MIDSLNAYLQSMPNEQYLMLQMHELLTYLALNGVVTLLILGMHGVLGEKGSDIDISYLADNAVQFRFFEAFGAVRQAISVIKTRTAAHERTIREFRITDQGLEFGEPLSAFHGVLTGIPTFSGEATTLLSDADGTSPGG